MIQLLRDWINRHFSDPQVIILGFLLLTGFVTIYFFGHMLVPVFAGIVIAYLLEGMVVNLQRLKIPRIASVLVVFLFFMAGMLVLFIWLLPLLSRQLTQLPQELPLMFATARKHLMELPEQYPDFISETQIQQVIDFVNSGLTTLVQRFLSFSLASVRGLITIVVYLVLVPFLVFFFLKDKIKIIQWLTRFLPENSGLAVEVWQEANVQIENYIRGKIWQILIVWSVSSVTFTLLGMQFTTLLSLFVGLSVLVPYIGATIMFFPVALIAYFQWGLSVESIYPMIAYGVIQLIDASVLSTLLLSEVVNLHPVAIIVAVLIFGGLWGIWGLFFAIPLATLVQAVLNAWFKKRPREKSLEEGTECES